MVFLNAPAAFLDSIAVCYEFNKAVLAGERDILRHIFSGPRLNPLFKRGKGQLEKCYSDEDNGRLIWIYRLPADDEFVVAPFLDSSCKNFIIVLNFHDQETHTPHTEELVRESSKTSLVPKRIMDQKIVVKKTWRQIVNGREGESDIYHANMIVYESVDGVKPLIDYWKSTDMNSAAADRTAEDIMALGRKLCSIRVPPSDLMVFDNVQAPLRGDPGLPALQVSADLSRWNIECDPDYHKKDPEVLRDAKPILALLNRHIPADLTPEAEISKDGQSITLHLSDRLQPVVFTASDMCHLRESIFLHHKMIGPEDVFITGTGKNCKVVALLGWETAEYCPSGYGMGIRDAMLGKQIKDRTWYMMFRHEGWTRREVKTTTSHPAQIKLADVMHSLSTWANKSPRTQWEAHEQREYNEFMEQAGYEWKGGRIGWHTSWTADVKNGIRERWR
ncbi:hypothetical protein CC79DRAFT_1325101 [Sarocladium strictum]